MQIGTNKTGTSRKYTAKTFNETKTIDIKAIPRSTSKTILGVLKRHLRRSRAWRSSRAVAVKQLGSSLTSTAATN